MSSKASVATNNVIENKLADLPQMGIDLINAAFNSLPEFTTLLKKLSEMEPSQKYALLTQEDDKGRSVLTYALTFSPKELPFLLKIISTLEPAQQYEVLAQVSKSGYGMMGNAHLIPDAVPALFDVFSSALIDKGENTDLLKSTDIHAYLIGASRYGYLNIIKHLESKFGTKEISKAIKSNIYLAYRVAASSDQLDVVIYLESKLSEEEKRKAIDLSLDLDTGDDNNPKVMHHLKETKDSKKNKKFLEMVKSLVVDNKHSAWKRVEGGYLPGIISKLNECIKNTDLDKLTDSEIWQLTNSVASIATEVQCAFGNHQVARIQLQA